MDDEELRRLAELRKKAVMDEQAPYVCGVEQGIEKGIKQGIKQRIKRGIEQGAEESKLEIEKSMKDKKCEIDLIIDVAGPTKEEIEKL